MSTFGNKAARRRGRNRRASAAFRVRTSTPSLDARFRRVRNGNGIAIFTIGYEGRTSDELVARLTDAGVEVLVDIRERAVSRRPDFRGSALSERCRVAGLRYESWKQLGSTGHQRKQLRESGNLGEFLRRFRCFIRRGRASTLDNLAQLAKTERIALLCYERLHEECHRSVVSELVADRIDATVVAIG